MALRVGLSCLVFIISLVISFAAMATSNQCEYFVRVKTGDVKDAGTDSTIALKLMSSSGGDIIVNNLQNWGIMGAGNDYFERGNLDVFRGTATCVNVCAITVTSDGGGNKPGWYLDYVEVSVTGSASTKFPVNQWLALDEWPHQLYANIKVCPRFDVPVCLIGNYEQ